MPNATIATTVSPDLVRPDPGDERGDPDDQLAVSEHRRAGGFPGLGQARKGHADRGERGEDGMARLDRHSCRAAGSCRIATGANATTASSARARFRLVGVIRRVGERTSGSTESMTSIPEDEDDGEGRQLERTERAGGVPGQGEPTQGPAAGRGGRPAPGGRSRRGGPLASTRHSTGPRRRPVHVHCQAMTGRTSSAIDVVNLAGSSTNGSCPDSSNQTSSFLGAVRALQ